jgi:hypothetical protein
MGVMKLVDALDVVPGGIVLVLSFSLKLLLPQRVSLFNDVLVWINFEDQIWSQKQ